jgi:hypothetical protein
MDAQTLTIERRFRGLPDSGHGGYVAGWLAQHANGPVAVRLHRPPPLEAPLQLTREDDRLVLSHGETLIADARPDSITLEAPTSPGADAAARASRVFAGFDENVFPGCFVCGPERSEEDGLRIFAGVVEGSSLVAAPWIPGASLADDSGSVATPFVWAALDCPGAFSIERWGECSFVLGEIAVEQRAPIAVGERCCVVGWPLRSEGRKEYTGTAIFDQAGECRAVASAIWIEIPTPSSA